MADLLIIPRVPISKRFFDVHDGYGIRKILGQEVVAIEDLLFWQGKGGKIKVDSTAVILPDSSANASNMDEFAAITEFSLSVLAVSGYVIPSVAALFSGGTCMHADNIDRSRVTLSQARFSSDLTGRAMAQWLQRCFMAHKKLGDRLHVTADRFVRYARAENESDGIMDLCISLESLLDSQTEISFKFSTCLAKVIGDKGKKAEDNAAILSEIYDLRSKLAHGDPSAKKKLKEIQPKLTLIRSLATRILTTYIWYVSEHTRDEWKSHIRSSIFV